MQCMLWTLILITSVSFASAYNDTKRLYDDVIQPYNRRFKPTINSIEPIPVYVSLNLMSLLKIVEVNQNLELNAWMNFTWLDEIRTWDPAKYGGVRVLYPEPLDIWRPRVLLSNSATARDVFEDNYSPFALFSNGLTHWFPGGIFSVSCSMDMTYFPFDEQECFLRFLGNDYGDSIRLLPSSPTVISGGYIPNGEWDFTNSSVVAEQITFGSETFSRIIFFMTFKRRPDFYLCNVLVPAIFLSFLSTFSFVLPEESGERASFSITVLLSLAVFMGIVSAQLPQNSDSFPLVVVYVFALIIHSGLCTVFTVCHLRWVQYQTDRESKMSANLGPSWTSYDENDNNHQVDHDKARHQRPSHQHQDSGDHPHKNGNWENMPERFNDVETITAYGSGGHKQRSQGNHKRRSFSDSSIHSGKQHLDNNSSNKIICSSLASFLFKDGSVFFFIVLILVWIFVSSYFLFRLLNKV